MDVTQLADATPRPRRVAVGEFDGVHLGHRRVIDANDTVLTFEPHPATVVHPERAPKLLTSLEVKIELIAELGVRELVVIPFDAGFAAQTPREFVDHILVGGLAATHVAVGDNFRFGHDASGTPQLLAADPRFSTTVESLVAADGDTISSTRIRELVAAGDMGEANRLLGATFRMRGPVVGGDQRGRDLGFPTANLMPDPALICPAFGVYACRARVGTAAVADTSAGATDQTEHLAAVSVGVRPTFGDDLVPLVEAYLLDFSGDLYGQTLEVEFVARLRGEERFDGVEPLITQMNADVAETRRLLA
jgi:riboflavin kinase/FMN adenylyltransferase